MANGVERFFSEITAKRIPRGTFRSVRELQRATTTFVAEHNQSAQPFIWTKSAATILLGNVQCLKICGHGLIHDI